LHFGGFLNEDLRRHDFWLGVQNAAHWLRQFAEAKGWTECFGTGWRLALPQPGWVPGDHLPRDPRTAERAFLRFSQLPADWRERFSDAMIGRTIRFLVEEARVRGIGRWLLNRVARAIDDARS
jgi:hypothetical protein